MRNPSSAPTIAGANGYLVCLRLSYFRLKI